MSSAPNHGAVITETVSSKPGSAVSIAGHVQQVFSHVKIENLVAGLSGGVVSTLVLHPLDLVKIRFAVSDGLDLRPKYSGILHCMRSVWRQEGLRGLYQGVTPNIWGAGASWGLYFFFYNAFKGYTKEGRQTELSATEHLACAAEAGTAGGLRNVPCEPVSLFLPFPCRNEGAVGFYKGIVPNVIRVTPACCITFVVYENLSRYLLGQDQ
ncbi:solute carrier family 25 member 32a [Etheostoma cragini]|uniref:solute carrier family 25 member 32a n=1 Tax=Etheostoma cragini TaxID=417921 RepID=UPI00155F3315|nr:solute carrier family 25 member 32a [Etheostoma cragini]